jgi:nucleotide-binding universal stress UspA family protein
MKILVAVDGSGFSNLAVAQAADIAVAQGAEILLLTVSSVINMGSYAAVAYMPDSTWEVPTKAQAEEILEEAANALRPRGIAVRTLHKLGGISDTILEVAEHEGVDLIVVGSHGRTGLTRFLLGSVSSQVASHALCSVLVAKEKTSVSQRGELSAQAAKE